MSATPEAILRFVGEDAGLGAQFAKQFANIANFEKQATRAGDLIGKSFGSVAGIVAGISFVRIASELLEYNEQLEIASARTGIQVEQLQKLQFIAGQSETQVEAITSSINKFQVNLVEGNKEATAALGRLGISITELNALKPDEQFLRIATAVAEIRNPAEQSATAIRIFGRGGAELLPLLKKGADGIREIEAQFDSLGVTISTETVQKVDDAGDAVTRLGSATKGLGVELLSLAAGPLTKASDSLTFFLTAVRFGLRGDHGGHGDNEIANIDRDIELLEDRLRGLRGAEFGGNGKSIFFTGALNNLIQAQAQMDGLIARQKELLGLNPSPIAPVGVDAVALPKNVTSTLGKLQEQFRIPTVDEKRRAALGKNNNPVQIETVDPNALELQINQERLDALLKQETDHAAKVKVIDGELAQFKASVRETFGLQEISFEKNKNDTLISVGAQLFGVLARENSKFAKVQQAIAVATTIWDTAAAVMKAFREVPYPANFGVAAVIAGEGLVQLAKIRSTNYNGGGTSGSVASVGGGGSAAGTAVSPIQNSAVDTGDQPSGRTINVFLNGPVSGPDSIKWIMDGFKDLLDGNDTILFSGNSAQARLVREGN